MAKDNVVKLNQDINLDMGGTKKPLATIENLERLLAVYNITVQYNPIAKDIIITIPDKEMPVENKLEVAAAYVTSLCHEHKMSSGWVYKYLIALAHRNRLNPVQEWINSKAWDGVTRLDEFYATMSCPKEQTELKNILMMRWMVSAVAAAYEPKGISAGGVLVLQGKQYLGKTKWFKSLVPDEYADFRKDGLNLDTKNKDSLIYVFSRWLVELGEIEGTFKKSELAALKAFITADMDLMRCPYDKSFSSFPRSTVFFGSVNDRRYLYDATGNRRFWTIGCTEINHTHNLDMQQIWAEFKVLYDNGEKWHLTQEEFEKLNHHNQEFEMIDPMMEKLRTYYQWERIEDLFNEEWKTATQILEAIGYKNPSKGDATKCGIMVAELNGNRTKRTGQGRMLLVPPIY